MYFVAVQMQDQKALLPWLPSHMFHSSPSTEQQFAMEYDCYGDSFTQDATVDSLKKAFNDFDKDVSLKEGRQSSLMIVMMITAIVNNWFAMITSFYVISFTRIPPQNNAITLDYHDDESDCK